MLTKIKNYKNVAYLFIIKPNSVVNLNYLGSK